MLIFSVGEATDICVEDPCDGYTIQKTDEEHEWTIVPDDVLWIDLMAIGNNIESAGWTLKEEMGALAKFPSRRKTVQEEIHFTDSNPYPLPITLTTKSPKPSNKPLFCVVDLQFFSGRLGRQPRIFCHILAPR